MGNVFEEGKPMPDVLKERSTFDPKHWTQKDRQMVAQLVLETTGARNGKVQAARRYLQHRIEDL